ncbi:MAG: hypothetical protein KDC92_17060, partial [Bacteroidetes bacterium]|nr:hypothetical protein [Bacteroidota bacterium]
VVKSFLVMADNYVKMDKLNSAKGTLKGIIENYDGEDLKAIAQQKLAVIEQEEERRKLEQEQIQKTQEDSIEYNDKTE